MIFFSLIYRLLHGGIFYNYWDYLTLLPIFYKWKSPDKSKATPHHIEEEFRVEFQFLDSSGNQKINKSIFKDSVKWLAAFYFPWPFSHLSLLYWKSLQWDVSLICWKKLFSWQKRKGISMSHAAPKVIVGRTVWQARSSAQKRLSPCWVSQLWASVINFAM